MVISCFKISGIVKDFQDTVGEQYDQSRAELIKAYGEYCNYCDMRIPDSALAIEHLVPKSSFPDKMLDYGNFYLACPSCNVNKSNKPSIADLETLTGISVNTMDFGEYQLLQEGVLNNYMWPRSDNNSYTSIDYQITCKNDDNVDEEKDLKNFIKDELESIKNGCSYKYDYLNNKIENNKEDVVIIVNAKSEDTISIIDKDKVNNTIELLNLNKFLEPTDIDFLKLSDRRVFNRTRVATSILLSINRANKIIAALADTNRDDADYLFGMFIEQFADTVMYSGFFSLCIHMLASNNTLESYEKDEKYIIGIIKERYIGTKNDFVN